MQDMAPQTDGQLETGAAAAIFGIAGMAAGHNHLSCCKGASLLEQESVPIFAESRRKITPPLFEQWPARRSGFDWLLAMVIS